MIIMSEKSNLESRVLCAQQALCIFTASLLSELTVQQATYTERLMTHKIITVNM